MEGAFLSFQEELVFSEALKDLRNVLVMSGQAPGIYQNIVYVDNHESMKEVRSTLCIKSWNSEGAFTNPYGMTRYS